MSTTYRHEQELLELILQLLNEPKRKSHYLEALKSDNELTEFISDLCAKLAETRDLFHYSEYYTFDHVLYRKEDRITEGTLPFGTSRVQGTWLKHIRIALEHENHLDKAGGYQELTKLILFNADFKVLMGWADKGKNYDSFAREYQLIYKNSEVSDDAVPILFIGEYADTHVDAYLITTKGLMRYNSNPPGWNPMDVQQSTGK